MQANHSISDTTPDTNSAKPKRQKYTVFVNDMAYKRTANTPEDAAAEVNGWYRIPMGGMVTVFDEAGLATDNKMPMFHMELLCDEITKFEKIAYNLRKTLDKERLYINSLEDGARLQFKALREFVLGKRRFAWRVYDKGSNTLVAEVNSRLKARKLRSESPSDRVVRPVHYQRKARTVAPDANACA